MSSVQMSCTINFVAIEGCYSEENSKTTVYIPSSNAHRSPGNTLHHHHMSPLKQYIYYKNTIPHKHRLPSVQVTLGGCIYMNLSKGYL